MTESRNRPVLTFPLSVQSYNFFFILMLQAALKKSPAGKRQGPMR